MNNLNLDRSAAQAAQEIGKVIGQEVKNKKVEAKELENIVTKALGVLQEQGVYAAILFLLSRSGDKTTLSKPESLIACYIVYHLLKLLSDSALESLGYRYVFQPDKPEQVNNKKQDILIHLTKVNGLCDNLDHLLLIKEVYEQTLIYARFGAKASGKGD